MTPISPPPELARLLEAEPKPQRSFGWNRDSWASALRDQSDVLVVLGQLPDRVDRHITRELVLGELHHGRVLPAFVAAMVWGYGTSGYGPTRVRWVLTGSKGGGRLKAAVHPAVAVNLSAAVAEARSHGPLAAFQFLNNAGRVKHLGAAFFTKWLYFASALSGPDDQAAAPILDRQVGEWLKDNAGVNLRIDKTTGYAAYLDLLRAWGHSFGRTPVQVEKAIFGLATGRD